ncbi:putative XS domain-containing protein [Helianthus annuus]|nr:putative XS domain-containing protein [Helianthus annuus]
MQSRRHEDFASQSSFDRHGRDMDIGRDGYIAMSPRSMRSWSPRRMEAAPAYSDRALAGRRSISLERRRAYDDSGRVIRSRSPAPAHSDRALAGRRSISLERRRAYDDSGRVIRSRSPPYMEAKRGRPFYKDDWVSDRDLPSPERRSRYEFFERMDRGREDVEYSPARNEFGYGHGSTRTGVRDVRDDKFEARRFDSGVRELPSQKSAVMGGLYKSTGDVGPISKPDPSGDLTSAPLNIGLGQIGKERVHYPDVRDAYSFDKFASVKHYADEDKIMAHPTHSRDTSYSNMTAIRSKEPIGASHFKDYARTSPRKSRIDQLDYRGGPGGMPLPRDNSPLNSRHMPEPLPHSRYEQRQHLDLHRNTIGVNDDMAPYREERFSPPRTGHLDTFHLHPRTREKDEYLYPSDEIYEKMDIHERVGYNGRDVLKPNMLDRVTHRPETSDMAHRNMSSRRSLDRIPLTSAHNIGLSRSPAEKRESAQYLDTVSIHSRLGRKVTREDEMPYMGMAQVRETERRLDYDYDYNRGLSPGSHKERMKSFRGLLYERERKMEEHDLPSYDSSSRYLKRKGAMEDEENRIHSRNMMSRLDTVYRRHNRDFRDEEWIDLDAGRSRFSERTQKVYDDDDFIYDPDEFVYYYDHDHDHDHGHHMRSHTYDDKHAKGYPRSSGRVGYNSYYPNRRNVLPRWKNDKDADMYSSATEQHEPHEDTKEFKQLVNDYFLSFTKKLNENSVVRRRYMEQGRGGSLYCIVCGRSLSKEFLDAQRLAMHAFMSRKGGLRAQHLGLLKALCVMFGWNSVLPSDTPRWFPETLSTTEASAQKQDLIIWPPVVIVHNISITSNNSNGEGPITVEALGQYLRGVGLSGGKVKLGKPANCSIMLVKFLGTFSGLQEAEKIHECFLKKKHGRKYLEQTSSSKGKSNQEESAEKEAERVLFGYMGIAEDLDKVDIDTKRKCSIKSKKEIQDIADAPVKPGE